MSYREVTMLTKSKFGKRLRAARDAVGCTQAEAAEVLGVSRGTYAQYEAGRREPGVLRVLAMVKKLGLDPAILFPEFFGTERGPK
jgi:transcriptional regulator with XRE-family HTH domain